MIVLLAKDVQKLCFFVKFIKNIMQIFGTHHADNLKYMNFLILQYT